jgi:thymidine kinase
MAAGGTGKSSTMIAGTYHIILHSGINRKCVFTANTQDQINSIQIDINKMHIQGHQNPEYMLHSALIKKLLSEDENNLNEYKDSIIFMDECTYISQDDLVELDKICDKYGIDIIYSGDVDQGGIHDLNIDNIYAYSTPILIDSFRAYSDILRYNLHP